MTNTDSDMPFILKRRQFPIRLSYAMTISKSQGQGFDAIGIMLHEPVFGHGQLYVAFSRSTDSNQIKVFVRNTSTQGILDNSTDIYTANVVYHEVL